MKSGGTIEAAHFSSDWLRLREAVDARSRNSELASSVAARFALRDSLNIVDLGSGTGSNLRATSELLPRQQSWMLIDQDEGLLATGRTELIAWADRHEATDDGLRLWHGGRQIDVRFQAGNLARDLETLLSAPVDLITASAFFDLVSVEFIRKATALAAEKRASVYASLTYSGQQRWTPHRPADAQMSSAFHRHQLRDKGFGPAAGPMAASHLVDQLRLNGYVVLEGDSPWQLRRGDRMLLDETIRGHALAVIETGAVDEKTVTAWVSVQRTVAYIGHIDVFGTPT